MSREIHIKGEKRGVPALRFRGFEGIWESLKLKQLIKDLQSGISVNSEDRPITDDSEFGILKTSAVADGVFKQSENKKIVDDEVIRAKLHPTKNEIIISRMNTPLLVGMSGYIDKTYPNLFVPDRLWQTLTYTEKCHNRWLSYFLITNRVRYDLKSIATGTSGTMKNISKPNFLGIKVNLPTLPEQQKIASFLSAVDEKIQQLTKKKALLEQYKKGVMQQLFSGKLRFKDEQGKEYPEWEEKRLGEVCKDISYGMNAAATVYDGLNKYLRITDIDGPSNRLKSDSYTSPDGILENKFMVKEGDVLFARTGASVGKSYLYRPSDGVLYFAGFLIRFNVKEGDPSFIYLQTQISRYHKWVKVMSMRSGQPGINAEEYKSFKIDFPCLPEQQKIATYLSSIDTKIESVQNQITQSQTFKKGLLQQMFV